MDKKRTIAGARRFSYSRFGGNLKKCKVCGILYSGLDCPNCNVK